MHCWGLQMVNDFVLRLTNLVVLIVGSWRSHDIAAGRRRIVSGQEKKEFWLDGRLAIESRMDPIALREGFQIWEMVGKSFCINVSVTVEFVLQLRLSVASNLDWPANSRRKFGVTSGGPRSTAAPRDFSAPTWIVNPIRALLWSAHNGTSELSRICMYNIT
jgi:hypothetical protein